MKELILVVVGAALVNNIILSQFQGLCPFLGVSKKTDTAAGMGMAVIFVITLSSAVTSLIYQLCAGSVKCNISADHRIYSGHCRFGTVC